MVKVIREPHQCIKLLNAFIADGKYSNRTEDNLGLILQCDCGIAYELGTSLGFTVWNKVELPKPQAPEITTEKRGW